MPRANAPWLALEQEIAALIMGKVRHLLHMPNVTSLGVGRKLVRGAAPAALCVQFTVERKLAARALRAAGIEAIPPTLDLGGGRRIGTDVVERCFALAMAPPSPAVLRRSRLDEIAPGISIGRRDREDAGTLGAIVFDRSTGAPLALSNWHVLSGPGSTGDPVLQPGQWDDGRLEGNVLGALARSYIGPDGDCAVATIDARRYSCEVLELGVKPARSKAAALDDPVVKSGRTTGVTFGIVNRSSVLSRHQLPTGAEVEVAGFEIAPDPAHPPPGGLISDQGDSGSLWLSRDGVQATEVAVGLHFACETTPGATELHALACGMQGILEKLDVTLAPPA